jgi:hypothetical protein
MAGETVFKKKSPFTSLLFPLGLTLIGLLLLAVVFFIVKNAKKITETENPEGISPEEQQLVAQMDKELRSVNGASDVKKIARVGREYLFESDLYYYAYTTSQSIENINKDEAVDYLVNDSVLLQAAEKEGWIELSSEIFNNPFKDYQKRAELKQQIFSHFEENKGNTSVEVISVWFYNMEPGDLAKQQGIEKAKELAKSKIDGVYALVKEQGKSMEEASTQLIGDTSLLQLDKSYQSNAYALFEFAYNTSDENELKSILGINSAAEGLIQFLKGAHEGDVSEIYLEKDTPSGNEDIREAYYAFYKILKKKEGKTDMYEFIRSYKGEMFIEIY